MPEKRILRRGGPGFNAPVGPCQAAAARFLVGAWLAAVAITQYKPGRMRSRILVVDFDGTLTERDLGDAFCDRFAPAAWREIDGAWVRGELSLPEAQRRMWALARATREQAVDGAREIGRLRAGLDALLDAAEARGVEVWLASGGFDFYIEALLGDRLRRFGRAWFNRVRFEGDRLWVEFPHEQLACGRCAVCKAKVCAIAAKTGAEVLFAGDGHSDRCAAPVADRLAAVRGSALAGFAVAEGIAVVEFDRLDELIPALLDAGRG